MPLSPFSALRSACLKTVPAVLLLLSSHAGLGQDSAQSAVPQKPTQPAGSARILGTPTPAPRPGHGTPTIRSWKDYWRAVAAHSRDSEPDAATMVRRMTSPIKPTDPMPQSGPLGSETNTPYFSGADTSIGFSSYAEFAGFQRLTDCSLSQIISGYGVTSGPGGYGLLQSIPGYEKYLHNISGLPASTLDKFPNGCVDPNVTGQLAEVVSAGKTTSGNYAGAGYYVNTINTIFVGTINSALAVTSSSDPVVGYNIGGILTGDFNGDGHLDLAVLDTATPDYTSGQVSILLSNGDGTYKTPIQISAGGASLMGLVAADFNGDKKVDLVATALKSSGDYELLFFAGNGDGTFKAPVATDTGSTERLVNLPSDVNKDGAIDIVGWDVVDTESTDTSTLDVMLNNGTGKFTPTLTTVPGSGAILFHEAVVGDLNADGKLDLVYTDPFSNSFTVLQGTGTGTFTLKANYPTVYSPDSAYISDFDGDGHQDILIGLASNGFFGPVTAGGGLGEVLLGNGDFTFSTPASLTPAGTNAAFGSGPRSFAVADLNGDGKQDIAAITGVGAASSQTTSVSTFLGNGTQQPTAGTSVNFAVLDQGEFGTNPTVLAVPLTGTTPIDLIVTGGDPTSTNGGSAIQVAINNGSGTFTVKSTLLKATAAIASIVAADFNGDGKTDVAFVLNSQEYGTGTGLYVALGNGDGTFQTPFQLNATGFPYSGQVFTADINGDGKADIIAVPATQDFEASSVLVYLSTGTAFAAPVSLTTPDSASITWIIPADFNGDGKLDLGVIGFDGNLFAYNFYLFTGNKTATFTYASTTDLGQQGASTGIALDVNQDGILDLVVDGCCGLATPSLLLGKSKGVFYPPQAFLTPQSVQGIQAIKLNADAYPDLVMGLSGAGSASGIGLAVNHYASAPALTKAATTVVTETGENTFIQGADDVYFPITVKETSAAGQPEGTVTISDGSTVLQTIVLEGGTAYFDTSSAPYAPGKNYTFTVAYSGDNFNLPSTGTVTFNTQYETLVTLTASPIAVTAGQTLTLTAKIVRANASGFPTGDITIFYEGGNAELGDFPLVNGVATIVLPTTGLPAGEYVLQAGYYSGDNSLDADGLSPLVDLSIAPKGETATYTALALSPNPITENQTGIFTATVVKGTGTGAPTGTVSFSAEYFGTIYQLGAIPLNASGQASISLNTTALYAGYDYTIMAVYNGNSTTYTSTAPDLTFYLRPFSYVYLETPSTTITPGQNLVLTAVVPQETYESPTGAITFYADGAKLSVVNLVQGSATYTIPTTGLPAGNYTITATYSGDEYNGTGSAMPLVITVQ